MKKKLFITVNNGNISGVERFVIYLSKYINKNNYELIVGIPFYGNLCDELDKINVKYFIFNKKENKPYRYNGIRNLYKYMKTEKFDIVHAQAGIVPCILGRIFKAKLLIEHKHGLDFTDEQIFNMSLVKKMYEKLKKYFVNYTMTVCNKDKNILIEKFGYKENTVKVMYLGTEPINETGKIDFSFKKDFVIGNVGRLTYQKAQEYFIEMASLIEKHKLKYNIKYNIYGDGENYDFYKRLIKERGLCQKVFLKGYFNDVGVAFQDIDIFVLTSRYEGIPYVILEAMEHECIIISTEVGGVNEIIIDSYNGFLVPKENPEILKEKVIYLLNNFEVRENIRKNAKMNLRTSESVVNDIEKFYESKCQNN